MSRYRDIWGDGILRGGTLPLLTLVVSLVPQFGNFLSSWIEPTLQPPKT
jgi:hypothetical protein